MAEFFSTQAGGVVLRAIITGVTAVLVALLTMLVAVLNTRATIRGQRALALDQALREWRLKSVQPALTTAYARRGVFYTLLQAATDYPDAADKGSKLTVIDACYSQLDTDPRLQTVVYQSMMFGPFKEAVQQLKQADSSLIAQAAVVRHPEQITTPTIAEFEASFNQLSNTIDRTAYVAEKYVLQLPT